MYRRDVNRRIDDVAGPMARGNKRTRFHSFYEPPMDDPGETPTEQMEGDAPMGGDYERMPMRNRLMQTAQAGPAAGGEMSPNALMAPGPDFDARDMENKIRSVLRMRPGPSASEAAQQVMDEAGRSGVATDFLLQGLDVMAKRHGARPFWQRK